MEHYCLGSLSILCTLYFSLVFWVKSSVKWHELLKLITSKCFYSLLITQFIHGDHFMVFSHHSQLWERVFRALQHINLWEFSGLWWRWWLLLLKLYFCDFLFKELKKWNVTSFAEMVCWIYNKSLNSVAS